MRNIQSFNFSRTNMNQNSAKLHCCKAEGISTELTGFHETAKSGHMLFLEYRTQLLKDKNSREDQGSSLSNIG